MLLIGSRALVANFPELEGVRKTTDWDFICTIEQFTDWHKHHKADLQFAVPTQGGKYYHARGKDGMNYEFELAWPDTSAYALLDAYGLLNFKWKPEIGPVPAVPHDLYLIKMSHRYKRNSPHFLKTMSDIKFLREKLGERGERWLSGQAEVYKQRQAESYDYAHPKLNVTSKEFFNGDGVQYVYDHDSIHLAVALDSQKTMIPCPDGKPGCLVAHFRVINTPAYTRYMKDGSEVMTSKEKFFSVDEKTRLHGVYEEACVLALERSQIPHGLGKEGGPSARWSFEMALMKVCTSITSGWFREYAWENYEKVLDLYNRMGENDYINRFKRFKALLKPYTGENY